MARYRGPDGKQRSKQCGKKADATAWLSEHNVTQRAGTWVDPNAGKLRFGREKQWTPTQVHLRASSAENDAAVLRARVLTRWKDTPLREVGYINVQAWVAELPAELKPASVVKVASTFRRS